MIYKCGKCGKVREIVVLVDNLPYCEDCAITALGNMTTVDTETEMAAMAQYMEMYEPTYDPDTGAL